MKTVKTTASQNRTTATIDLEAGELPESVKREVGEFLVEQALARIADRVSPVTGERFAPLTDDYRKKKTSEGLPGIANLEASGDMLDSLDYRITSEGIEFGVFGEAALRADGHNNLSGESQLPTRQFIPKEGEGFVSDIEDEVARIIADAVVESPEQFDFSDVESPSDLYNILVPIFGLGTRTETRAAVLRSVVWYEYLARTGLIRWL